MLGCAIRQALPERRKNAVIEDECGSQGIEGAQVDD